MDGFAGWVPCGCGVTITRFQSKRVDGKRVFGASLVSSVSVMPMGYHRLGPKPVIPNLCSTYSTLNVPMGSSTNPENVKAV